MNQHVKEMHKGAIKVYQSRRDARVKANPMLDQYIDPVESIFPSSTEQMQTGSTAPSESRESRQSIPERLWRQEVN
jgi:hypothetical protein